MAAAAREAAGAAARLPTATKDFVLSSLAELLLARRDYIMAENAKDVEKAKDEGLPASLIERLRVDAKIVDEMAAGLKDIAALADPVREIVSTWRRPSGLLVGKMRIPIGVIAIIYESRPNVTVDAFALCLKSGNAVILKGGREAFYSNRALFGLIGEALGRNRVPEGVAQLIETSDRDYLYELLKLNDYIDLVIPRGGEALIRSVAEQSRVPVLKHYKGVCAIFVDERADEEMAVAVCLNAKVQKAATCNAMETLLVHKAMAPGFLPVMLRALRDAGVAVKGCARTRQIVPGTSEADRGGLERGVPRPRPLGKGRGRYGRGDRAHKEIRLPAYGRHYNERLRQRVEVREGGQLIARPRQRVHALKRRLPARTGRRDGHKHDAASRLRPYGPGGAYSDEVHCFRRRAGETLNRADFLPV